MFNAYSLFFRKVLHAELENSLSRLSSELEESQEELQRQKSLNEKLELDLLQVHKSNKLEFPGDDNRSSRRASPDPSAVSTSGDGGGDNAGINNGPIPFTSSAETSILPIVTSQRDRFRQRNAELEEVGL